VLALYHPSFRMRAAPRTPSTVVETSAGRVTGRLQSVPAGGRHLSVFRGIPYARAPIGEHRFRPAEPAVPWAGVLAATQPGPAAPQPSEDPISSILPGMMPEHTSEDCLRLDLYAPAGDGGPPGRPVMVWVHGGAFVIGSGSLPTYDASLLAAEQGVVVVSPNYRLGALGFLHLPDAGVAANCGLSDLVQALQWVRQNVAVFGGDPGNVTLFGESAGAGAILHLLVAPAAAGLFRRAILQSPGVSQVVEPPQAGLVAERFLRRIGGVSRLWSATVDEVVVAQTSAVEDLAGSAGAMPFHPVVDGSFLPEAPLSGLARGRAASVSTLIGTTAEEMQLFASAGMARLDLQQLVSALRPVVTAATGRDPGPAAVEALVRKYESWTAAWGGGPAEVWAAVATDGLMRLPVERAADAQAEHQPHTYVYNFAWRPGGRAAPLRACHAIDLPFAFGTFDKEGWAEFLGAGAGARRVSTAMRAAWASFARDGSPSIAGGWPPWEPAVRTTLVLDDPPICVADPSAERRAAWDVFR
jgi:para-nitrobenzyl esterase